MKPAWVVVDLAFGDSGKGATVDALVRRYRADWVIRHHGGAQAGHNVVTEDGRHHTFSQFGAGSLIPGVRTLLGPAFIMHPLALLLEAQQLHRIGCWDALERLVVSDQIRVITPVQQAELHLRELARGAAAHGTTGVGIDPCVRDAQNGHSDNIIALDLGGSPDQLAHKLRSQQQRKRAELDGFRGIPHPAADAAWSLLDDTELVSRVLDAWAPIANIAMVNTPEAVDIVQHAELPVFEGAQGILLDEVWGFYPHTTWGDCTFGEAKALLGDRPFQSLGVTRSVTCRHGAGPLPGYTSDFDALSEPHNTPEGWQGAFRKGALDVVLLRYALDVVGPVDGLAINHMDWVEADWPLVVGHDIDGVCIQEWEKGTVADIEHRAMLTHKLLQASPVIRTVRHEELLPRLSSELATPVRVTGSGPTASSRRWFD